MFGTPVKKSQFELERRIICEKNKRRNEKKKKVDEVNK